jgi:glycosyltransferase involved in cell wall biosynthesis
MVELIIVDDGSKDGTREILKEFQKKYAEKFYAIKLIFHDKNYGVSKARNDGIKEAEGECILVLDHDVVMPPETLKAMHEYLTRTPSDVIAVVALHHHVGGGFIEKMEELIRENRISETYGLTSCALIRGDYAKKNFYDETLGPPYTIYEDIEYGARAYSQGFKIHVAGWIKVAHLMHGGVRSKNKHGSSLRAIIFNRLRLLATSPYAYALSRFLRSAPLHEKIRWFLYSLVMPYIIALIVLNYGRLYMLTALFITILYVDILMHYFNLNKLHISLLYSAIALVWRILRSSALVRILIEKW